MMARASSAAQQRSLSLTEELERLEQSITLTLQEIDHNFSKAHRIVTTSILPIVEQYANHSKDVWDGSKFWKQFFESSANVSLSGYEEQPSGHETIEETVTEDSNATTHTTLDDGSQSYDTPSQQHISTSSIADIDLSNLSVSPSHSTPRPTRKQGQQPAFADYPSPYEALRQEVNNTMNLDATTLSRSNDGPTTPGRRLLTEDVAMTPGSSPVLPRQQQSASRPSTQRKKTDPLLHRVLDKTYRIQATPLTANRYAPNKVATTPATRTKNPLLDATMSSSPVAPPELHAEVFSSPERRTYTQQISRPNPRTPGVSVLTPARDRAVYNAAVVTPKQSKDAWDSEDESHMDEETGMPYGASPPKTMQFHIPQSRLLKTPAKEASRRIVDDILQTAGVRHGQDDSENLDIDIDIDVDLNYDDDDGYNNELTEGSPSVVRKAVGLEDETF